MNRRSDLPLES